jgi:hypothetical protein
MINKSVKISNMAVRRLGSTSPVRVLIQQLITIMARENRFQAQNAKHLATFCVNLTGTSALLLHNNNINISNQFHSLSSHPRYFNDIRLNYEPRMSLVTCIS